MIRTETGGGYLHARERWMVKRNVDGGGIDTRENVGRFLLCSFLARLSPSQQHTNGTGGQPRSVRDAEKTNYEK